MTSGLLAIPKTYIIDRVSCLLLVIALITGANTASSHGGVVLEEDLCVINIGFLKAHFTIYQTEESANEEFCEDLPDVAQSRFLMEYMHDFLREMPVDFRVIRDIKNLGMFANWDDVAAFADLENDTVFYLPPSTQSDGVLDVIVPFIESGAYIGIVTASHPVQDKVYRAVFPFQVGGTSNWGYLPLLAALLILTQLCFSLFNRKRSQASLPV